jgi:hypothetical protein
MYPVSLDFQTAIKSINQTLAIKITIETAFETLQLTDADIVQGSAKLITESTSTDKFELGSAVAADFAVTLLNDDGRFQDKQFNGGVMVPWVGVQLPNQSFEYVPLGVFNIDEVSRTTTDITLESADNILLFDIPFNSVPINYPATALQILLTMCSVCGVTLKTTSFLNSGVSLSAAPDGNPSCRDILEDIAEIACCFARCDRTGELELVWYSNPGCVVEANIDGNTDSIDGGDFSWYNNKTYDGGSFVTFNPAVTLDSSNRYSLNADDDPITITGISYAAKDQTYLLGSNNYALQISDNPFINTDPVNILQSLSSLIGFCFMPFTSDWQGNPALDCGDAIRQIDFNGNPYNTIVTNSTYKYRDVSNLDAKGASLVAQAFQGQMTKKVTQLLRQIDQKQVQLDSMNQAILNATNLIAGALGGYAIQGTGQYEGNFFIADNADITRAAKVWRWNLGGFGYSSTGVNGPYATAITADGSIVANVLTAQIITGAMIKAGTITGDNISAGAITANMIKTGTLQSLNGSSAINLDNGSFSFSKGAATFDDVNGLKVTNADGTISVKMNATNCFAVYSISGGVWTLISSLDANGLQANKIISMTDPNSYINVASNGSMTINNSTYGQFLSIGMGSGNPTIKSGNGSLYLKASTGGGVTVTPQGLIMGIGCGGIWTDDGPGHGDIGCGGDLNIQGAVNIKGNSGYSGIITFGTGHSMTVTNGIITSYS